MTATQTAADQVKATDTITAEFAGIRYTGPVRSVDPAVFTTQRTGVAHLLIVFVGGGFYAGSDHSISIPASQLVEVH